MAARKRNTAVSIRFRPMIFLIRLGWSRRVANPMLNSSTAVT